MPALADLKNRISVRSGTAEIAKATLRNVVTAQLYEIMERERTTKSDLAKKLKVSKAAVSALMSGDRNFTIDTITHISHVLGYRPDFRFLRGPSCAWSVQIIRERLLENETAVVFRRSESTGVLSKTRYYERYIASVQAEAAG
jgi:transcriptional regulator with XRE-family HTH domain